MASPPAARRPLRLLAVLALAALLPACRPSPGPPAAPLPDFRLAALDGGQLGPADLRGQVVVWDFWATWCGPCQIQAEILHDLWPGASGRGVRFVAVSVGEPEGVVRDFVREHPYPYPVLVDPEDHVSEQLRILGLPTLVVVDREGRVVFRTTGIVDRDALARVLERAGA
jgi:peroxiredoxin